jgi:H+/Cl- antiporter ClcA
MNKYLYHTYKDLKRTHIPALKSFFKWIVISIVVGILVGLVGSAFNYSIKSVSNLRERYPVIIMFMAVGGVLITLTYQLLGLPHDRGTNMVLTAVRDGKNLTLKNMVCIFVGSVITHLFGGSSGREGAGLQIGGSLASSIGTALKMDESNERIITMCGMSAGFSALFGTPITAGFFAMEVISIGIMHYSAIVPCMVASVVSMMVSSALGGESVFYEVVFPKVAIIPTVQTVVLSFLCAFVSILFCVAMHTALAIYRKYLVNHYARAIVGGLLISGLTLLVGTYDYNGTGMSVIERCFTSKMPSYAFMVKIIFTAITLCAGYKGGEIVPSFFVGATFGNFFGSLIGMDMGFGSAIGLIAVFCGVTNCPLTSMFLSVEIFGSDGIVYFGIACAISYLLSGYTGLYNAQKIVYSKTMPKFIDKKANQ